MRPKRSTLLQFRLTPGEKRRWKAAARRLGITVTKLMCEAMAERIARQRADTPVSGQPQQSVFK